MVGWLLNACMAVGMLQSGRNEWKAGPDLPARETPSRVSKKSSAKKAVFRLGTFMALRATSHFRTPKQREVSGRSQGGQQVNVLWLRPFPPLTTVTVTPSFISAGTHVPGRLNN